MALPAWAVLPGVKKHMRAVKKVGTLVQQTTGLSNDALSLVMQYLACHDCDAQLASPHTCDGDVCASCDATCGSCLCSLKWCRLNPRCSNVHQGDGDYSCPKCDPGHGTSYCPTCDDHHRLNSMKRSCELCRGFYGADLICPRHECCSPCKGCLAHQRDRAYGSDDFCDMHEDGPERFGLHQQTLEQAWGLPLPRVRFTPREEDLLLEAPDPTITHTTVRRRHYRSLHTNRIVSTKLIETQHGAGWRRVVVHYPDMPPRYEATYNDDGFRLAHVLGEDRNPRPLKRFCRVAVPDGEHSNYHPPDIPYEHAIAARTFAGHASVPRSDEEEDEEEDEEKDTTEALDVHVMHQLLKWRAKKVGPAVLEYKDLSPEMRQAVMNVGIRALNVGPRLLPPIKPSVG